MSHPAPTTPDKLARRAREQFVAAVEACLDTLAGAIGSRLVELVDRSPSTREAQVRRDALVQYERERGRWVDKTRRALQRATIRSEEPPKPKPLSLSLELIGDDVVEQKIIASRLAMSIHEKATWELNDLKVRMLALEGGDDLTHEDVLRPEALSLLLIEQWMDSGLSRQTWLLISDVIQQRLGPVAVAAYREINDELIRSGVVPDVDLNRRVKRGAAAQVRSGQGASAPEFTHSERQTSDFGERGGGGAVSQQRDAPAGYGSPTAPGSWAGGGRSDGGGTGRYVAGDIPGVGVVPSLAFGAAGVPTAPPGFVGSPAAVQPLPVLPPLGRAGGENLSSHDDPGASSTSSPLVRARAKAQGVIGQMRKLLVERIAGFDPDRGVGASTALSQALTLQHSQIQTQVHERDSALAAYSNSAVLEVARDLRERSGELKQKATTSGEKAVIEIVALMFQCILAEERIPSAVRVWFARLQMPVMRVALAEPEFFSSLQHPARQLIDRMGSCVLGFDASAITGSALEAEIRRVVQTIEQYPETGRKVFQLAFDEFQKFLSRFLTERGDTQRLVTVAQQVIQKETMSVRYTIELRKMLENMPVREEIRSFLFKVWAEVMAVAAVRSGPQHADTLALKKSASELVWAASAKPNRTERAQVIQGLPHLLQRLRQGMSLLGMEAGEQEAHIKTIGDTLADAFQSKTAAIPAASIEAIARRLANLEEFVGQEPEGELPLVAESIELMLGMDAAGIDVITDGGVTPSAAMLAWARELQPGTWFSLDHNGQLHQVQYAWRSEHGQLHLFVSVTGRSFLVQAGRLASYLQAGLVLPAEEEALTVRATREALAKIDANPERLFS